MLFKLCQRVIDNQDTPSFNLPEVDWFSQNISSMPTPVVDLGDHLFLNQQVPKPTKKSNIID